MIEIINLTKNSNKKKIISDFSFSANKHECLGLFGKDPTVKTALLDVIAGTATPCSGHIVVRHVSTKAHPLEIKKITGYQRRESLGHPTMSVKEFLDYIATLRGLRGNERRAQVEQATTQLELLQVLNTPIDALSTRLKRKVAIAQAILHTPALLLLDEPTEGFYPDDKHAFSALLQQLTQDMTVIVASRHCDELSRYCTRALVIAGDRLVADTPMQDLQRDSRHFQAVTLAADAPLDLLALAVLPGVAGIEEHQHDPGTVTVLAMPGHTIYPHINTLIANRGWKINSFKLEPGRLSDVVHHLSLEARL